MANGLQQNPMVSKDNIQSKSLLQATRKTTNVGTFQYQDGQISLAQNQQKPTQFFFTPLPHVEPNQTECYYNDLSDHHELLLTVSLYTPHLLRSIKSYIKQHQTICHKEHCDVSLLPIHSIRLFQKGLRTNDSQKKYNVDTEWHSNKQLRQSIKFIVYTSNMSVCENLKNLIATRCHLSSLEIHYQLHGQQTMAHKIEITTEHIISTSMYDQIRSQFPSDEQDTVALTGNDYKNFLTDITNQITQSLRTEEDYDGLQDSKAIEHILERQLQSKQAQLKTVNDHLWNSLYWPSDLTRPDQLSKVLNKIIKQDATDSNIFHYDHSQVNEDLKQQLKLHEKQKLINLEQYLAASSEDTERSFDNSLVDIFSTKSNSTDMTRQNITTRTMPRKDAEKLINYISEHVQLASSTIIPKSLHVKLVKFGLLIPKTTLFSGSVLVKTRANIHILPLRCPNADQQSSALISPPAADEDDELSNTRSIVPAVINDLNEKMNNLNYTILQLTRVVITFSQMMASFISTSETSLDQKLTARFSRLETLMYSMESRLMQKIQQSGRVSTGNQITDSSSQNSTGNTKSKKKWKQYAVTVAGGNGGENQLNQLGLPFKIFVDVNKTIYISDYGNHRIIQWKYGEEEGQIVAGGNEGGDGLDQLKNPTNFIVDEQTNTLIIADRGNRRVIRRSLQNQTDQQVLISNIYCYGLAMDKDRSIYVSDLMSNEVRRLKEGEEDGQIIAGGNGEGNALNQLNSPTYLFVDDNYSLYITDSDNHRVMKWAKDANEGIVVAGGKGKGSSLSQLSTPRGIILDDLGQIYVADLQNARVMRWTEGSTRGEIVVGGKGEGDGLHQLHFPTGLSFDADENLYVADCLNYRVQKFEKVIE